ncbi:hypothetical protein IJG26_01175 [Candidatus Saccharibacteria bacterium]|nr:hypothetical protein [Candidatus Saccharibacteria bacterium]
MKKQIARNLILGAVLMLGIGLISPIYAYADEEGETEQSEEETSPGTSISITPVSNVLQISSNSEYEAKFTIDNDGPEKMRVEVYAAPYSYVHSEEDDSYKLGFNNENNFTQISRWIKIKDVNGYYVEKAEFTIEPKKSIDVHYKIITPDNIPVGGQYAVIFAHTLTASVSASGIRTEASPGLVIYARSNEGDVNVSAEVSNLKIDQSITENNTTRNHFFASAKIKNSGNVDFTAVGKMKVESIIGFSSYETPDNRGRVSIIPEAELVVSDEWEETPSFGVYKVTWSVRAGEVEEAIDKIIVLIPPLAIILTIIVLTFIVIWIIMGRRKRKERRSRLAV